MNFSMCIGGLKYNIDCLTEQFYKNYGVKFQCPFSDNNYNIIVKKNELINSKYYDKKLSLFLNEEVFVLDKVIKHCLNNNRMIIHASAIEYKSKGYLFMAPSGVGKTTHTLLWKKYLNDEVTIINGDKPMLEFNDRINIHSTPWRGKEGFGENISATLGGIVVLKQSSINSFKKLNTNDSIISLMKQCFYSTDKEYGSKVISYIGKIVRDIPIYLLECDISKEAFNCCYNGLIK